MAPARMATLAARWLAVASLASAAQVPGSSDHCLLAHRAQGLFQQQQQQQLAHDAAAAAHTHNGSSAAACSGAAACPPCVWGSCMLWGDPHVYVFDGEARLRVLESGDFWIVRSACVHIQSRYGPSRSGSPAVVQALALGGSFLQGHVLAIEPRPGRVTWDGREVLAALGSAFVVDGLIQASYGSTGDHVDPGLNGMRLQSLEAELPLGVRLVVNRWSDHLDVLLTMRPLPGGQDGHCGNFNGNSSDDTLELISARAGGEPVRREERLLPETETVAVAAHPAQRPRSLKDCEPEARAKAEQLCRQQAPTEDSAIGNAQDFMDDCIFDACFAGQVFAREGAAIQEQMAQRAAAVEAADCSCAPPSTTAAPTTTTATTTKAEEITCVIWGDPHVLTFDLFRLFGSDWDSDKRFKRDGRGNFHVGDYFIPDFFRSGDYYVVKSSQILIQARYGDRSQNGWPLRSIGLGGSFIQGHALTIEKMWEGKGTVSWDGQRVPDPSSFVFGGLVTMRVEKDANGLFLGADIDLPGGVSLEIKRSYWGSLSWASVSCAITMPRQAEGQDGQCGKADGDLRDDTTEHLAKHAVEVPSGELIFLEKRAAVSPSLSQAAAALAKQCEHQRHPEYEDMCRAMLQHVRMGPEAPEPFVRACAVDICAARGHREAAESAIAAAHEVEDFHDGACGHGCHGSAGRPVRRASNPALCLHVYGDKALNGSAVKLWRCLEGREEQQFLLPAGREGLIRWAAHAHMCLDIAGGQAVQGARVQIWECQAEHPNMQFKLPEGSAGRIQWVAHPDLCLDVAGGSGDAGAAPIALADCGAAGDEGKDFLLADDPASSQHSSAQ